MSAGPARRAADAPDLLQVTLDKEDYAPGEAMKIKIASRFAGTATVAILNDQLELFSAHRSEERRQSRQRSGRRRIGARALMPSSSRIARSIRRRSAIPAARLGLAWFSVAAASHKLGIAFGAPEKLRPHQHISVPITLAGLAPGDEAYVTLAAVDVGILNLTHYQTPDPGKYFYGQRTLASEIRDLYGFLIDGMQGALGAIRSGGDAGGELQGNKPTEAPLALFSGVVKVGPDGKAEVGFDLPPFNGTMRLDGCRLDEDEGRQRQRRCHRPRSGRRAADAAALPGAERSFAALSANRQCRGAGGRSTITMSPRRGPVSMPARGRGTIKLKAGERTSLSVPLVAHGRRRGRH